MKIAIGCDHAGVRMKETIKDFLTKLGHTVEDFGTYTEQSCDYPDIALEVSTRVANNEFEKGILICGTGIGMCIAANKVKGIRAALCHDTFSAKATREHNNANILTMGARVIGEGLALDIVKLFVETEFSNEVRHQNRVNKISTIENQ
ncbi:ribose 5-phosphate isomerase B [Caldicellulosiruptoraceae bacterium PP1]